VLVEIQELEERRSEDAFGIQLHPPNGGNRQEFDSGDVCAVQLEGSLAGGREEADKLFAEGFIHLGLAVEMEVAFSDTEFLKEPSLSGLRVRFTAKQITCYRRSPLAGVAFPFGRDLLDEEFIPAIEQKQVNNSEVGVRLQDLAAPDGAGGDIVLVNYVYEHVVAGDHVVGSCTVAGSRSLVGSATPVQNH
jgi:hypothetical protein